MYLFLVLEFFLFYLMFYLLGTDIINIDKTEITVIPCMHHIIIYYYLYYLHTDKKNV